MKTETFIFQQTKRLIVLALFSALLQACGSSDDGGAPPSGGPQKASSCISENQEFVNNNFSNVNITQSRGGLLYDKWWIVVPSTAPSEDHPMWADRQSNPQNTPENTTSLSGTWRCKECHGWDYKGASGAYASGSSHYTGFKGIDAASSKSAANVFCAVWDGTGLGNGQDERHSFNTSTTGMTKNDVLAITKFIVSPGDKGLVDTSEYVDANKNAIGDVDMGESIYTTKAQCGDSSCHDTNGDNHMDGGLLGELASDNPWEVLHKIRYGHPGSTMPSFISGNNMLTVTEIKNVLAYAQTLPGGSGGTSACATENQDFVNANILTADIKRGGQLYDKWWVTASQAEPMADHAMWADRQTNPQNTTSLSGTWRCKECHGWDYKGANGAYAQGSSHYTGFTGIDGASGKAAVSVFCSIWDGTGADQRHAFNTNTTGMTKNDVLAITRFITAPGDQGLVETNDYINSSKVAIGDATAGQTVFTNQAGCGSVSCHGADGDSNMGGHLLGELANDNPWEVLHKIRYGHPGSVMPSFIADTNNILSTTQIKNVLAYAQTLPGSGGTVTGDVARGGQLFDKWWVVTADPNDTPNGVNPLFTTILNANPTLNIQTPTDVTTTWRCKHCHGWDYAGKDGAYGPASSNFTGVKGLIDVVNRPADELRALISNSQQGEHAWSQYLSTQDIEDLVAFVKNGIVDTSDIISRSTKLVKVYDQANGQYLYNEVPQGAFTGICAICHGTDGRAAPPSGTVVLLGPLALDNPWEVLHKTRFGQPGTAMPKLYNSYSIQDAVDILGYVQTLP